MKKSCFTISLFSVLMFSVVAYSQSSDPIPQDTITNPDTVPSDTAPPPDTTTEDSSMEGTSLKTQQEDTTTVDTSYDDPAFGWDGMNGGDPPARFEIGVLIGEPMALSAKYWLSNRIAIGAGAGWSFSEDGKLDILGDILLHPYYIPLDVGDLPTYIGAGVTFRIGDGDSFLGVRFPIGAEFLLSGFPITLTGEIVPIMEVIPDMDFRLGGGAAIRFAFGR
ncbi:MAG: hypothetical protein JW915_19265 [Chitinispirillaceae bacterium]|nr:hypothetical protein [Chitinispirillaceae bacterium]